MSRSKLCPHSLLPNSGAPLLVKAGCPVIKVVDDMGLLLEAQQLNPSIIGIGRFTAPRITGEELRHVPAKEAALFWFNSYVEKYRLNPHVQYIEGPNEPVWSDLDGMAWYGEFEAERVRLLAAMGRKAVVGNFSTGVPHIAADDRRWWKAFLPALRAAKEHGGLLAIHAYSSDNINHDPSSILRYRMIHELILIPNGLADLPIVITEFGRLSYKERVTDEQYANELIEIDGQLAQDKYLLGATIFTFGSTDQAWNSYDVANTSIPQRLADHILAFSTPPTPEPPPQPEPLAEGIDVSRWNGTVNWNSVSKSGISFAICRISDGLNTLDGQFENNWRGSNQAGLVRGAYQYFRASQDGKAQAELFLSKLGKLENGDLPPALDIETDDGQSASRIVAQMTIWLDIVESKTGVKPIIYTSPGFWNKFNLNGFEDNDLWVAHWNVQTPQIPKGWTAWRFWQYTSRGQVPGITGSVDRNRFNGTLAQLQAYVTRNTPPGAIFPVGARVKVTSRNGTKALNVRHNPSGTEMGEPLGTHQAGDVGTVDGPAFIANLKGNKITWVHVNFDSAPDGNVSQAFLDPFAPPASDNLLVNAALQDENWLTDDFGNQRPRGWDYKVWMPGDILPFPTKHQGEATVNAICGAVPENVHKRAVQLPPDEQAGQSRQLIFPGTDKVYKSFGNQGAIATELSQTIDASGAKSIRIEAWILVDAPDTPTAPNGQLEADHAVVGLRIGEQQLSFNYGWMKDHLDIQGVNRAWNHLSFTMPVTGQPNTKVGMVLQKNWPGPTAFFIGPVSVTKE